jgi:hypothetical protein
MVPNSFIFVFARYSLLSFSQQVTNFVGMQDIPTLSFIMLCNSCKYVLSICMFDVHALKSIYIILQTNRCTSIKYILLTCICWILCHAFVGLLHNIMKSKHVRNMIFHFICIYSCCACCWLYQEFGFYKRGHTTFELVKPLNELVLFPLSALQQLLSTVSKFQEHFAPAYSKTGGDMLLCQFCHFLGHPPAYVEQYTPLFNGTLNYLNLFEVYGSISRVTSW